MSTSRKEEELSFLFDALPGRFPNDSRFMTVSLFLSETSASRFSCFLRHGARRESQKDSPLWPPPSFFLASVFPLFASFLLLRRVYSSFLSVAWKVHRKEWAPSGGRRRGREGGAPQLLFAVRKRYHLPTYTEEGGAEKGVTMAVRL